MKVKLLIYCLICIQTHNYSHKLEVVPETECDNSKIVERFSNCRKPILMDAFLTYKKACKLAATLTLISLNPMVGSGAHSVGRDSIPTICPDSTCGTHMCTYAY